MNLKLTQQESDEAIHSLKRYFDTELDVDLSDLQAKFLLDYVLKELGSLAYNRGVQDAEAFMRSRLDDLSVNCFQPAMTYWQNKKKR